MTCDSFTAFMAIFYPLVIVGLIVDHYFIAPTRAAKRLVDKCMRNGRCVLCERPMTVVE